MQATSMQIISILVTSLLFNGCEIQRSKMKSDIVYYKNFDIFRLKGIDTLESLDMKKSVEVKYINTTPVSIKYYKPDRTITLILEDSFSVDAEKPLYVFSTSNFHGGLPGAHRVYTSHNEEYKDLLYVNLSDTIICKSYEITKLEYYSYTLYLYVKNNDGKVRKYISGSDTKEDKGFSKRRLYLNWLEFMRNEYLKGERKSTTNQGIPE